MGFWRELSLHFRLTLGMLCMLVFLIAAGMFGLKAVSDVTAQTQGTSRQVAEATERRVRLEIGIVLLFGLSTVLLVSGVVARSIRRPLRDLKAGAEQFGKGDLAYRVPIERRDELGEVIELFNSMAAQLESNQEDLSHAAFHDTLTGLPNRSLFHDRLVHALARQERDNKPLAVLLIDLDDFKTVNDSLGHAAGDQLLVAVSEGLKTVLRPADTAARLGGDEFAVLVEDMRGRKDAIAVARRVIEAFTGKTMIDGKELFVHGSVGVAITYGGEQVDDVLRNADVAMYAAKQKGKNRFEIFDSAMQSDAMARLDLKTELKTAVEKGEFQIYYQPIVSLDDGRIVGAEALVRWDHPSRGIVAPGEFLATAEETGLILDIGRWVLQDACSQASQWQVAYDPDFMISINLSARQMQEATVVSEIRHVIETAPIATSSVTIEVNETALTKDPDTSGRKLKELRALGVHIAIDDFGTGYSSLSFLRRFPIETIKIDKSFTDGVARGPEESALARALIKLADTLGMETVAEGVEDSAQVEALKSLGCKIGQGTLYGGPVPAQELGRLLSQQMGRQFPAPVRPSDALPA